MTSTWQIIARQNNCNHLEFAKMSMVVLIPVAVQIDQ